MAREPARDSFQVLDWIISRGVHEYLDVAGRPVGEGRAQAFQGLRTEMRTCPYAGSRYRHAKPMNATALQQMPAWQELLTVLSWLSGLDRARHQAPIANSDDLARVTSMGVFLADFLVLRCEGPLKSGEIPVLVSGLYKICLGFQLAYLTERFAPVADFTKLPDARGFLEYVERDGLLIGEAEVCAGSPGMILQAYEAIVGVRSVMAEVLPPSLAGLGIDWDRCAVFAGHAGSAWSDIAKYAIDMTRFLPELSDPQVPQDVLERLNTHLTMAGTRLLAAQSGLVVEIARAVRDEAGEPAGPLFPEPSASQVTPSTGSLAAVVTEWLSGAAAADMATWGPVVAVALHAQLCAYDNWEADVLAGLDRHVSGMLPALGYCAPSARLTPAALSQVCGRTLRDWPNCGETEGTK